MTDLRPPYVLDPTLDHPRALRGLVVHLLETIHAMPDDPYRLPVTDLFDTLDRIDSGELEVVLERHYHGLDAGRLVAYTRTRPTVVDAVRSVISDVLCHGPALSDIDDDDLAERLRTAGLDPTRIVIPTDTTDG